MKYLFSIIICFMMSMASMAQMPQTTVNVGVMLPLHNIDGDGRRMVEYYRGMLMAVEKLKADGMNVNIYAWNVHKDVDVRSILIQEGASKCNIIFGPLYTKQVKPMADFCRSHNIKLVIPFSISGNDVEENKQIYQVYQSPEEITKTTIEKIVAAYGNYHPVFIDCNDTTSRKGNFTFALRKQYETKGITYNITNLKSSEEMFAKCFTLDKPNIVFLNTGRSPELTKALNKLDVLRAANQNVQVILLGYTEWLMYVKYNGNRVRFCKYDVQIPTHFYYNEDSDITKELVQKYRWRFHQDMMVAQPSFAITGYDHAMYFIGNQRSWQQTPLDFKPTEKGGFRNKAFMFIHYKQNGGIEALSY